MVFEALVADLAASELGTEAEYERVSVPGVWEPLRVLICGDVDGLELGPVRSVSPVAVVEVPRAWVGWVPARGDRLRWAGRTWVVDEPPVLDRLGVVWRLACHREEA